MTGSLQNVVTVFNIVSLPEIACKNRDQIKGILDLVSILEIEGYFFSVSSQSMRLSVRNSRSRLDARDWVGEFLILISKLKKNDSRCPLVWGRSFESLNPAMTRLGPVSGEPSEMDPLTAHITNRHMTWGTELFSWSKSDQRWRLHQQKQSPCQNQNKGSEEDLAICKLYARWMRPHAHPNYFPQESYEYII